MTAKIINGKQLADSILSDLKVKVSHTVSPPSLCVIRVLGDPATEVYVRKKKEACEKVGIRFNDVVLSEGISQKELLTIVDKYNKDESISGIIVQLPLPEYINSEEISGFVNPAKDVDGLNPASSFVSATAKAVIKSLESINFEFAGANVVVVGRSNLVGKPVAKELLKRGCAVTVCHSKTDALGSLTKNADLLVVAVGKAGLISKEMVKEGAVVVDVGINRVNGKLVGDVDFEGVKEKASYITPVPGGIGPMTVACLLDNLASSH